MKFTNSLSLLFVLLPVLSETVAVTVPLNGLVGREPASGSGKGGQEGNAAKGGNTGANNAAGKTAAATTAANDAATATTAAAATASSASTSAAADSGDAQTSLTLDPAVIANGFANDGQSPPVAGQVASLTSTNNFINFCLTVPNTPITNGQQITTGSCNPAPIGTIPSVNNMPSAKFTNPLNGATIQANTAFNMTMAIQNMETGNFVNADTNYFAAPQQLNAQGQIVGHSHVVIEAIDSLTSTTPTNPQNFAFFKGLNDVAANGVLSTAVTAGVPAGVYRMCSINSAANHQPAIVPIAQHGALDDCSYFTATDDGTAAADSATAGAAATTAAAAAAAASTSAAATGKNAATAAAKSGKTTKGGKRRFARDYYI